MKTALRFTCALAAAFVLTAAAHAGRSCEQKPLTAQTIEQGMALAPRTAQALDAEHARSGARVVVLGNPHQLCCGFLPGDATTRPRDWKVVTAVVRGTPDRT